MRDLRTLFDEKKNTKENGNDAPTYSYTGKGPENDKETWFLSMQASSAVSCNLKFRGKCRLDLKNVKRNMCSKSVSTVSSFGNPNPIAKVKDKINYIFNWYEEMSGLKDVRIAQDKVTEASDRLATLQEQRRQASAGLAEIQYKLKQIYAELDNTKRGEDRYVQLITQENKLLKEEEFRQAKFKEAEVAEREQFTALTNAVKNSHEKERFQSKKTQYWSIIGSVIGAVLGIIGTSINNHVRLSRLKELINTSTNEDIREQLENFMDTAEKITTKIANASNNNGNVNNKSLEDLICNLSTRVMGAEEENRKLRYLILTVSLFCVLTPFFTHCLYG